MAENSNVVGLHPCQNQRVEMEAGGPLRLTPCEQPALPCLVDGQRWYLCEHHKSIYGAAEIIASGYRPGPTSHSEG